MKTGSHFIYGSPCSYIKERESAGEWGMCDVGFCCCRCFGATMNDKQCSADTIIFLDAPPARPGSHWNGSQDANRRKREKKEKKEVWLRQALWNSSEVGVGHTLHIRGGECI